MVKDLYIFIGCILATQSLASPCVYICIDDHGMNCETTTQCTVRPDFVPDFPILDVASDNYTETSANALQQTAPCSGRELYVEQVSHNLLGEEDLCSLFRRSSLNQQRSKIDETQDNAGKTTEKQTNSEGLSLAAVVGSAVGGLLIGVIVVMFLFLKFGKHWTCCRRQDNTLKPNTSNGEHQTNEYSLSHRNVISEDPVYRHEEGSGRYQPPVNQYRDESTSRSLVFKQDSLNQHQYDTVEDTYEIPDVSGTSSTRHYDSAHNYGVGTSGNSTHDYHVLERNPTILPSNANRDGRSGNDSSHGYFILENVPVKKQALHPPGRNK